MDQTQTKHSRYEAPGVHGAAPLAARERAVGRLAGVRRGLWSWLKTATVVLAGLYVVSWFFITASVAWLNRTYNAGPMLSNTVMHLQRAEPMRAYALPKDPGISLEQANDAYLSLYAVSSQPGFAAREASGEAPARAWRAADIEEPLFPTAPRRLFRGPPSPPVITAAGKGFNAREREVLRMIATAPVWPAWDLIARAPRIDRLGTLFETPFGDDAHVANIPVGRGGNTSELAHAAIARAAWHYSEGRRDSAEMVLRAVVSHGLQMIDNASVGIDAIVGNAVVTLGRDALIRMYALTGDPRGRMIEAEVARAGSRLVPASLHYMARDFDVRRAGIEAAAEDLALPRGVRGELLGASARLSCGNGRELLFGMRDETRALFDRARRDFARYPSERALIDVIERSNEVSLRTSPYSRNEQESFVATMDLLGRIYFNPRLASCTMNFLSGGRF
jgi:hypothetical protein